MENKIQRGIPEEIVTRAGNTTEKLQERMLELQDFVNSYTELFDL